MRKSLKIAIVAIFAILLLMFGIKFTKAYDANKLIQDRLKDIYNNPPIDNNHILRGSSNYVFLGLEDLYTIESLLCTSRGTHITDRGNRKVITGANGQFVAERTDLGKEVGLLTEGEDATIFRNDSNEKVNWSRWIRVKSGVLPSIGNITNNYTATASQGYGLYEVDTEIAKPAQAYILSNGGGYLSHTQYAWWYLNPKNKNKINAEYDYLGNQLFEDAKDFESYICQLVAGPDKSPVAVSSLTYDSDGYVILPSPAYKVSDNTNYNNIKVLFDSSSNSYIIGPFNMQFVSKRSRNGTLFAGITGAELKGKNISNNEITITGYSFLDSIGTSIGSPGSNTNFYVSIPYSSNLISLTSIKFNFKYMNAAGKYQTLNGDSSMDSNGQAGLLIMGWRPYTDMEYYHISSFDMYAISLEAEGKETSYILNDCGSDENYSPTYNIREDTDNSTSGNKRNKFTMKIKMRLDEQISKPTHTDTHPVDSGELQNFHFTFENNSAANIGLYYIKNGANIEFTEKKVSASISLENGYYYLKITISNLLPETEYTMTYRDNFMKLSYKGDTYNSKGFSLPFNFTTIKLDKQARGNAQDVIDEVMAVANAYANSYDLTITTNPHANNNPTGRDTTGTGNDDSGINFTSNTYYYRYVNYLKKDYTTRLESQFLVNVLYGRIKEDTVTHSLSFNPISLKTSLRRNGMVR